VTPRRRSPTATIGPGGAVKASARDLGNWLRFHLAGGLFEGKQLVDPKLLAETKAPHTIMRVEGTTAELNPETNLMAYAMGWNVSDYRGELLVAHAGALNGARTHVVLLPERNAGFAIMINVERGYSLYAMRHAIADILRDGRPSRDWNAHTLAFEKKTDEKGQQDREERLAKRAAGATPTRPLADYAGTYAHPAYGSLQVLAANGQLELQWQRIRVPLTHFQYDTFQAESPEIGLDESVRFSLDDERKVQALTLFGERFSRSGS
jgi:CubicO group peptidase (beta-lactamase class C family)